MDPGIADAYIDKGILLCNLKRYQEAQESFKKALELDSGSAEAHCGLGTVYSETDRLDEGETECRKAITVNPQVAAAHRVLASILAQKKDYAGAADEYKESLKLEQDFSAWNNLGDARENMGDLAGAETSYRKAVAMVPGNAVAHFNLGSALAKLEKKDEAAVELRKALELDPNYTDARKLLESSAKR